MQPFALRPVRTVAPAAEPISLAEAKAHLRVDASDEDALITAQIQAAVSALDGWSGRLGRCLVTQTWRQDFRDFPAGGLLRLPFPDVSSVIVTYVDEAGETQTLSSSTYHLVADAIGSVVVRDPDATWPTTDDRPASVSVTLVAGYGAAGDVPASIRAALLLMVGDLYRNRETMVIGTISSSVPMSMTVSALLAPHCNVGI